MSSTIHLIRHGTTEGNIKRWYYGNSDIPLLEEGKQLISSLKEAGVYPNVESADFYTSGLIRTEETFQLIFGEIEHTIVEKLQEMHFGDFEKHSYEELKENKHYLEWIEDTSGNSAPPNGESKDQFVERVRKGFQQVLDSHRLKELSVRHAGDEVHSVVVCHGGVISAIMATYFPDETKHFFAWLPDLGHGYTLEIIEGNPVSYTTF